MQPSLHEEYNSLSVYTIIYYNNYIQCHGFSVVCLFVCLFVVFLPKPFTARARVERLMSAAIVTGTVRGMGNAARDVSLSSSMVVRRCLIKGMHSGTFV